MTKGLQHLTFEYRERTRSFYPGERKAPGDLTPVLREARKKMKSLPLYKAT